MGEMGARVAGCGARLREAEEERGVQQSALLASRDAMEVLRGEARDARSEMESRVNECDSRAVGVAEERDALQAALSALQSEACDATTEMEARMLTADIRLFETEIEALRESLSTSQMELEVARGEIQDARIEMEARLQECEARRYKADGDRDAQQSEVLQLRSRLETVKGEGGGRSCLGGVIVRS
jgi:chromosome segregation ATPase